MHNRSRVPTLVVLSILIGACGSLPPECSDRAVIELVKQVVQEQMPEQPAFSIPTLDVRAKELMEATTALDAIVTKQRASSERPMQVCEGTLVTTYNVVTLKPSPFGHASRIESLQPGFKEAKAEFESDPARVTATGERGQTERHLRYTTELTDDGRVSVEVFLQ